MMARKELQRDVRREGHHPARARDDPQGIVSLLHSGRAC